MNIGELIYNKRKELHLTLEEVGKAVGVSKSTVKKWETGYISNMKRDKIALLANVLQINPSELIGDTDNNADNDCCNIVKSYNNIFPVKKIKIPMLGKIACGQPIYADQEYDLYIEADGSYRADFYLKAQGESMINANIDDGDIVLLREMSIVNNGDIAAVIVEEEATLKRVYYDKPNNKLVLQAENPKFPPLVYLNEELNSIRIIGKAVAVMKKL